MIVMIAWHDGIKFFLIISASNEKRERGGRMCLIKNGSDLWKTVTYIRPFGRTNDPAFLTFLHLIEVFLNGPFSASFFFIFVFLIHSGQLTIVQYIKKFFANDWIRTADHWYRKQPLYQLSHNHCPWLMFDSISKSRNINLLLGYMMSRAL